MKILAIIPARGGSKRIERKNIKSFAGKPIIGYSIEAALRAGCFEEVMVSTDDDEIAEVALRFGAKVPFMRSAETANDYATTADVINEVVARYAGMGRDFDAIACIYATAPFVTAERLRRGAAILTEGRAEAAFTCVEYSYPIQRSLAIGEDGRIAMKFPQYATARSQDLPKTYHDAGQFYFTTLEAFRRCGSLWGPDTLPIILPEMEVQDLDTMQDWQLAELKFTLLREEEEEFTFVPYTELTEEQSEALRQGRNDPEVCRRSVNRDPVSAEEHRRFVSGLADRDDCRYYAVYSGPTLLGSVNIHFLEPGVAERGIWIATDQRGKGLASRILKDFYARLRRETGVRTVITRVRVENVASRRLEGALGARETERDDEFITYELKL